MEYVALTGFDVALFQMLPAGPGTYVMVLWLPIACHLTIGRALESDLDPGHYLYVGSALRGLRGRLSRYLIGPQRVHWHIDYLLRVSQPSVIWYREGAERLECLWANRLAECREFTPAIPRFGSSDCRCPTHLYYAGERPSPAVLQDACVQSLCIAPE